MAVIEKSSQAKGSAWGETERVEPDDGECGPLEQEYRVCVHEVADETQAVVAVCRPGCSLPPSGGLEDLMSFFQILALTDMAGR